MSVGNEYMYIYLYIIVYYNQLLIDYKILFYMSCKIVSDYNITVTTESYYSNHLSLHGIRNTNLVPFISSAITRSDELSSSHCRSCSAVTASRTCDEMPVIRSSCLNVPLWTTDLTHFNCVRILYIYVYYIYMYIQLCMYIVYDCMYI